MKKTIDNYASVIDKLSNPVPLFFKDDPEPAVWACGSCEKICGTERDARHCYTCAPKACDRCGERVDPRSYCDPCSNLRSFEKEQAAFKAAEKIKEEDYEDPVVHDNEFYFEICDIFDDCYYGEDPLWAFACTRHTPSFDPHQILEWVDENVDVSEWDGIDWIDEKELFDFVNKWFAKQTATWWVEDRSRVVLLIPREQED